MCPAVIEYMSDVRKMLIDDNLCVYQRIQKELSIGSKAIRKIIDEELYMKNSLCRSVAHNYTVKLRSVRISKEIQMLINEVFLKHYFYNHNVL